MGHQVKETPTFLLFDDYLEMWGQGLKVTIKSDTWIETVREGAGWGKRGHVVLDVMPMSCGPGSTPT